MPGRAAGKAALALLFALALAGCAAVPVGPSGPGRPADPQAITQWTAKGRIALSARGEGGSGSFVWEQRRELSELRLRGPLGAGALDIVTDGERIEVRDGSGAMVDGAAARTLLEQRLGVSLPVAEFRYWMLGVAAPAAPGGDAVLAAGGFTQSGWAVGYQAFQPAGGWSLPARLTATTGDTRVRVVIDQWQVLPPSP
ncbi:MAG: lipoprotein insertase outer membrane protein LolB [Steroidobacteraceae bacterium]